jgi:hypothetical protein
LLASTNLSGVVAAFRGEGTAGVLNALGINRLMELASMIKFVLVSTQHTNKPKTEKLHKIFAVDVCPYEIDSNLRSEEKCTTSSVSS